VKWNAKMTVLRRNECRIAVTISSGPEPYQLDDSLHLVRPMFPNGSWSSFVLRQSQWRISPSSPPQIYFYSDANCEDIKAIVCLK